MKRHPFRTAQSGSKKLSVPKGSAGILLMGLALSASARDAGETAQPQSASFQGKAPQSKEAATHKPRRWYQVGIAAFLNAALGLKAHQRGGSPGHPVDDVGERMSTPARAGPDG